MLDNAIEFANSASSVQHRQTTAISDGDLQRVEFRSVPSAYLRALTRKVLTIPKGHLRFLQGTQLISLGCQKAWDTGVDRIRAIAYNAAQLPFHRIGS